MSTVLVIIGILVYSGPCALAYYLGYRKGYDRGSGDGAQLEREKHRMDIPNPNYCDYTRDWR